MVAVTAKTTPITELTPVTSHYRESVALHVTCDDLWDTEADRMRQSGRLTDGTDSVVFLSWAAIGQPLLKANTGYVIANAHLIPYGEADTAVVFREQTEIAEAALTQPAESRQCLSCSEPLSDAARHTGPEAPEIGWEYYKCPSCDHTMRPELL